MPKYSVESAIFVVFVETDRNNKIIDTAPITRKFLGQDLSKLIDWLAAKKANPILHYISQ